MIIEMTASNVAQLTLLGVGIGLALGAFILHMLAVED